jgi:hypothetical protein
VPFATVHCRYHHLEIVGNHVTFFFPILKLFTQL